MIDLRNEQAPNNKPAISEYEQRALDFLSGHGLEFRVVLVGDDCPMFCEDARAERDMDKINVFPRKTHLHGKHYCCTISGKDRGHVSFDFWNSYADEEQNAVLRHNTSPWDGRLNQKYRGLKLRKVSAYDLLACLQKYDVGTLAYFCSEFGYDEDSKLAEQCYIATCKEYQKTRKFFTEAELAELQEIN